MSKRPQFANYGEHQIPFNDSIGDLDYFRVVEDKWSVAFESNNLKELYNATFLYFIALKTRSKFDGAEIRQKLKDIEIKIYSMDRNNDGQISPIERMQNAKVFGFCRDGLITIFEQLGEIKVDAGWTLKVEDRKREIPDSTLKFFNIYMKKSTEILDKLRPESFVDSINVTV